MSDLPASIRGRLPRGRRGRIATLFGQIALHRIREAEVAEMALHDRCDPCPTPQRDRLPVKAERCNRGFTLTQGENGRLIARLNPLNGLFDILYWSLRK